MSMKGAWERAVPVGLALAPVGVLFGILAAQSHWTALDVLLMSVVGFSGSGQFAFLGFFNQGLANVGLFAAFLVILSINLRYIPMSLSATQPLRTSRFKRFFLAHFLADESYATERSHDDLKARAVIRGGILLFWAVSTVAGAMLSAYLPSSVGKVLGGLTFPVSAILVALSFSHVRHYCAHAIDERTRRALRAGAGFAAALLLMRLIGAKYFWLPSIGFSYWLLMPRRPAPEAA
jgi:predicted branched-subunit amino acid permease